MDANNNANNDNLAEDVTPAEGTQPASDTKHIVYYDVYDHGFTNGILKIPKDHFERFIDHNAKMKLAQKELGITLNELNQQEQLLAESRQKVLSYKNTIDESEHELHHLVSAHQQEEHHFHEIIAQKQALQNKVEGITPEYNWFNAWFFILIGFVFIASDFFITFDVVHLGLNMDVCTARVLAIAVSSITFIIKPTIDRIFEKPYIKGHKSKQHVLLIVSSLLAISVLGALGFFREKYFDQKQKRDAVSQKIERVEKTIDDLNNELRNNSLRNDLAGIAEIKGEIGRSTTEKMGLEVDKTTIDQQTRSHPILYWIFIACNILFGVAGAISLSIGFPVIDQRCDKRRLNKKIRNIELEENAARNTLKSLESQQKTCKDTKSGAENAITMLPDLAAIEDKISNLKTSARDLLKFAADNGAVADLALYAEAYERGLICEFNDKIIITPHQIGTIIQRKNNNARPSTNRQPRQASDTNEREERYLHQQIRNLIEYNHQNKKHLLNGEDA